MSASSTARKLLVFWAFHYLGWFAFGELAARLVFEGGFVLVLLALNVPWWAILIAWLVFHTTAWILIYGGYAKLWGLSGHATSMERLESFRAEVIAWAQRQASFERVYLRGSSVTRDWDERSDVDILVVPKRPWVRAVLVTWAYRARWVLRRLPLEMWWIDDDRYIPYRMEDAAWSLLSAVDRSSEITRRRAEHGILISFSGMDGSGKTTAAEDFVEMLHGKGLNAVYFYAHRLSYQSHGTHLSFAIGFRSFWRHAGRDLKDLSRHPMAKLIFDLLTVLDYTTVLWRLASLRKPNRITVVDRYVADVIAYLRFLGPTHRLAEGLLVGLSFEPDLALYFKVTPEAAFARKQEQTLDELGKFFEAYEALEPLLRLTAVRAGATRDEVRREVEEKVAAGVPLPLESSHGGGHRAEEPVPDRLAPGGR